MMIRRHPMLLLAALQLGVAVGCAAQGQPDWIAAAKRVSVKSLDSTLAAMPLERWLVEISGASASAIKREVNDCGEGGDGRASPTCVEAFVPLRADTVAAISLIVSSLEGKPGTPEVWSLVVGRDTKFTTFKTLAAWAAEVRAPPPSPSPSAPSSG